MELLAKSKQDKEFLDMAKQNKVSLIQKTKRFRKCNWVAFIVVVSK